MWKSEFIDSDTHTITAGLKTPVVLLPGWPQTAEAYTDLIPFLADHYRVIAVDPPGLGDSAPPRNGYDTASISAQLEQALRSRTEGGFHLVGHDVGAWIAYAWAAQFPDRIKSLTLLDSALPGLAPPREFPMPSDVNVKLWQFSFNTLPDLPELLTHGRERQLLDWLFERKAKHPDRISAMHRDRYVECYSRPAKMSNGFAYYRSAAQSAAQNKAFAESKLLMPVLALGGEAGVGDSLRLSMEALALHVRGGVVEDCGHYVMEEQPAIVASQMLTFFLSVDARAS